MPIRKTPIEVLKWNVLTPEHAQQVTELFKALADATRVRIVGLLAEAEICVSDLCEILEMSQPAVSHHLRILRDFHLVTAHRDGKRVLYRLADEHVRQMFVQGLDHARE